MLDSNMLTHFEMKVKSFLKTKVKEFIVKPIIKWTPTENRRGSETSPAVETYQIRIGFTCFWTLL